MTPPPLPPRKTGSWLVLNESMRRTSVRRRLLWVVVVAGVYGATVEWIEMRLLLTDLKISGVQSALGVVFSVLLVLRANTAYARWWEGRTLWGTLINTSRNLAVKVMQLSRATDAEKRHVIDLVKSFAFALRNRLRNDEALSHVPGFEHETARQLHVPVELVNRIYQRFASWRRTDAIDAMELRILDSNANVLLDVCGACERIARTPMVGSYVRYVRFCITLYLLLLPWALEIDRLLAPITMLWAFFLCGLELIAEIIEDPFGQESDDLQLDAYCDGIRTVLEQIASSGAPSPPVPGENATDG